MITRTTVWEGDRGVLQVSVCILDEHWEPLVEETVMLGPFDTVEEGRDRARAIAIEYLRTVGYQHELPLS